jgi:hypothetical protein
VPVEVTSALLADAARVVDGKLYVFGGQWDRLVTVSPLPMTHPSMALVVVFEVPYDEALEEHTFHVSLELDGVPLEQPVVDGQLQTGHAPGTTRGAPGSATMALTFNGLNFERFGRYEWVIRVDDEIRRRVSMEVAALPGVRLPGLGPPS